MRNQWSLISFTLLIQFSVGIFIVMTAFFSYNLLKSNIPIQKVLINRVLWVFHIALIIALVSSFFHLGKPRSAIYALSNLRSSWLSREILLIILILISVLFFNLGRIIWKINPTTELVYLIIISILGLLLIFSMSKIYMLETIPVWNNYYTIIQFYSSLILLGLLGWIVIINTFGDPQIGKLQSTKMIDYSLYVVMMVLILNILFILLSIWNLKSGVNADLTSYYSIVSENMIILYIRVILAVLAIGLILLQLFYLRHKTFSNLLIVVAILVLLSEIAGRYLFYASYRRVGI